MVGGVGHLHDDVGERCHQQESYVPGIQSCVVQNYTNPGSTLIRSEPGALGQPRDA